MLILRGLRGLRVEVRSCRCLTSVASVTSVAIIPHMRKTPAIPILTAFSVGVIALTVLRRARSAARPRSAAARRSRPHQRPDRHRGRREAGGRGDRDREDRIQALGTAAEIKALTGPNTAGDRPPGAARHSGIHREPRALRRRGRRAAPAQPDERGIVGQDRRDGRRGRVDARKPGEWIYGRGWHQEKWTSRPTVRTSRASRRTRRSTRCRRTTRCSSSHASGHAAFANGKAMELSGIRRPAESPPGGEILRDATGDATGSAARDGAAA